MSPNSIIVLMITHDNFALGTLAQLHYHNNLRNLLINTYLRWQLEMLSCSFTWPLSLGFWLPLDPSSFINNPPDIMNNNLLSAVSIKDRRLINIGSKSGCLIQFRTVFLPVHWISKGWTVTLYYSYWLHWHLSDILKFLKGVSWRYKIYSFLLSKRYPISRILCPC